MIVLAASWIACGLAGAYTSAARGRSPVEGLALGLLFGPVGLLVAALMPAAPPRVVVVRAAEVEVEAEAPAPPPRPRFNAERDDRAMDFVMDLIRESERAEPGRGVPRIVRPNGRPS